MNLLLSAAVLLGQQPIKISELPRIDILKDWADYLALAFTASLVLIGWWGVSVAIRTLRSIERQTQHMSASERPWLFLEPYSERFSDQYRSGRPISRFDWRISNRGKTVANVIEAQVICKSFKDLEAERKKLFPVPPNYGQPIPFFNVPIAPEGTLELQKV